MHHILLSTDATHILSIIGTILGFINLILVVKRNIWSWPIGIVMVIIFAMVAYNSELYAYMTAQIVFIFIQIYGWITWHKSIKINHELVVQKATKKQIWVTSGLIIISSLAVAAAIKKWTNDPDSFLDTFLTIIEFVAEFGMAKKIIENWHLWIIADLIGIVLFAERGLYSISLLHVLYTAIAAWGLYEWLKASKRTA